GALDPHQLACAAVHPPPVLSLAAATALELLDAPLVAAPADLLAPARGVLEVALVQRPAGARLHEPRRLGERADFVSEELQAVASTVAVFAAPSRCSFSRATGSETNWRSPFGTSATCSTARSLGRRSVKSASSRGSSTFELRASTPPASRSFSRPFGTSLGCVR